MEECAESKLADMSGTSSDGSEALEDDEEEEEDRDSDCETNEAENNTLKREQRLQEYRLNCEHLINFLKTRKIPSTLEKKNYRNIRNQAKTHVWDKDDKKLYYVGGKKGSRQLVLTDITEIDKVIREGHVKSSGVHMGVNNTLAAISCNYVWLSMKVDIANYVASCYHCQSKHRSAVDKMHSRHPIEFVQVDMLDEAEFTYDATVMLIDAVKKRYGGLSSRQARLGVFKEVQEELSQQGHGYSIGAVRRKWNSLVEMHKRMRREIYQKNPPWQFYMMIQNIDKEDESSTVQKETYPPHQGETAGSYPHQETTYPTHHANTYINNNQGNLYTTHHENIYPGHHVSAYNVHQGQAFAGQPAHQGNPNEIMVPHAANFFKSDPNESRLQHSQGHAVRPPPPPPSLGPPVMAPSANHQPPVGGVAVVPDIVREVQRLGAQQVIINNQLKKVGLQCNKDDSNKRRDRMDRLKVKHLKKIGKELQAIAAVQTQILNKQDQLLNAVMGRM